MRPDLVVFAYDHFYPDFTAGGPVRSLHNLSQLLKEKIPVRILTGAYEFGTHNVMPVHRNQWTHLMDVPVWYATGRPGIKKAVDSLSQHRNVLFYLNGIFSMSYFLYMLWLLRSKGIDVIVSPRGMLQEGAMKNGWIKKKGYLLMLRMSSLLKNVRWHATDIQESHDINRLMGRDSVVTVIPNIPVMANASVQNVEKKKGELRLVYFSIVSKKKNLHFLLELLRRPELQNVHLTIFGPVKDESYWRMCEREMKSLPFAERCSYHGELSPEKAPAILARFHALVLPTLGENFGHAIVEMLSLSRPVIISDTTPWTNLEKQGAGYSLSLDQNLWKDALVKMLNWDEREFNNACASALQYYNDKFDLNDLRLRYMNLFTGDRHDESTQSQDVSC
jgi:glycosyltransferase involved in cell wall biosynthesis